MITAPGPRRPHVGRLLFALLLALHGMAHFVGVAGTVRSIGAEAPVHLLGGALVTANPTALMLFACASAVVGTGFVAAAFMLVGREPRVGPLLVAVAAASLVMTLVGLWGTAVGALIDLAVLAVVTGSPRLVDDRRPVVR